MLISIRHNLLLFTFYYEIPCSLPKCEYANGKISPDFTHFLLECLGPDVPYTVLVSLSSGEIVETLEDNKGLPMSLPNNFNLQIYPSDLPVGFWIEIFIDQIYRYFSWLTTLTILSLLYI